MKEVKIILSSKAEKAYKYLNDFAKESSIEKSILNSIKQKIELIKANPHYGEPIAKKLIPKEYKKEFNITNLFWVGLTNYWRMIYSLSEGETKIEIISFILEIFDHKKYNKRFGYK